MAPKKAGSHWLWIGNTENRSRKQFLPAKTCPFDFASGKNCLRWIVVHRKFALMDHFSSAICGKDHAVSFIGNVLVELAEHLFGAAWITLVIYLLELDLRRTQFVLAQQSHHRLIKRLPMTEENDRLHFIRDALKDT